jgi:hypothetical protein
MLKAQPIIAFVATTCPPRAKAFYAKLATRSSVGSFPTSGARSEAWCGAASPSSASTASAGRGRQLGVAERSERGVVSRSGRHYVVADAAPGAEAPQEAGSRLNIDTRMEA